MKGIILLSLMVVTGIVISAPAVWAADFEPRYIVVGTPNDNGIINAYVHVASIINLTETKYYNTETPTSSSTPIRDDSHCNYPIICSSINDGDIPMIRGQDFAIYGIYDSTWTSRNITSATLGGSVFSVTNPNSMDSSDHSSGKLYRSVANVTAHADTPATPEMDVWRLSLTNVPDGQHTITFHFNNDETETLDIMVNSKPDFKAYISHAPYDSTATANFTYYTFLHPGVEDDNDMIFDTDEPRAHDIDCSGAKICIESNAEPVRIMDNNITIAGQYYDIKPSRVTIDGKPGTLDIRKITYVENNAVTFWYANFSNLAEGNHEVAVYTVQSSDPAVTTTINVDLNPIILDIVPANNDGSRSTMSTAFKPFNNGIADYNQPTFYVRGIYHSVTEGDNENRPTKVVLGAVQPNVTPDSGNRIWFTETRFGPLADGSYDLSVTTEKSAEAATATVTINTNPQILAITVNNVGVDNDPDECYPWSGDSACDNIPDVDSPSEIKEVTDPIMLMFGTFTIHGEHTAGTDNAMLTVNDVEYEIVEGAGEDAGTWSAIIENLPDGIYTIKLDVGVEDANQEFVVNIDTTPMLFGIKYDSNLSGADLADDMYMPFRDADNMPVIPVIKSTPFLVMGNFVGEKPELVRIAGSDFYGNEISSFGTDWSVLYNIGNLQDGMYNVTVFDDGDLQASAQFKLDTAPSINSIGILNDASARQADPDKLGLIKINFTEMTIRSEANPLRVSHINVTGTYGGDDEPTKFVWVLPNGTERFVYPDSDDVDDARIADGTAGTTGDDNVVTNAYAHAGKWHFVAKAGKTDKTGEHTIIVVAKQNHTATVHINTAPTFEYIEHNGMYTILPDRDNDKYNVTVKNNDDTLTLRCPVPDDLPDDLPDDIKYTCASTTAVDIPATTFTIGGSYIIDRPMIHARGSTQNMIMGMDGGTPTFVWTAALTFDNNERISISLDEIRQPYSLRQDLPTEILYVYDRFVDKDRYWFMPGAVEDVDTIAASINNADDLHGVDAANGLNCDAAMVVCVNMTRGDTITAAGFTIHGFGADITRVAVDGTIMDVDDDTHTTKDQNDDGDVVGDYRWSANFALKAPINGEHVVELLNKQDRDAQLTERFNVDITPTIEAVEVDGTYYLAPGVDKDNINVVVCDDVGVNCMEGDTLTINSDEFTIHGVFVDEGDARPNNIMINSAFYSSDSDMFNDDGDTWTFKLNDQVDGTYNIQVRETDFESDIFDEISFVVDTKPVFQYVKSGENILLFDGINPDDVDVCADTTCGTISDNTIHVTDFTIGGLFYKGNPFYLAISDSEQFDVIAGINGWNTADIHIAEDGTYTLRLLDNNNNVLGSIELVVDTVPAIQFVMYDDTYWILDDNVGVNDVAACLVDSNSCKYISEDGVVRTLEGEVRHFTTTQEIFNTINRHDGIAIGGTYYAGMVPTAISIDGNMFEVNATADIWTATVPGFQTGEHTIMVHVGDETPVEIDFVIHADTRTIGALVSTSGDLASLASANATIQHAVDQFNMYLDDNDKGWTLALDRYDDHSNTQMTMEGVLSFNNNHVAAFVGPTSTAALSAIETFVDESDMLAISYGSTSPALAKAGDRIFRTVSSDLILVDAFTALLGNDGIDSVVTVHRDGDPWGSAINDALVDSLEDMGINTATHRYTPDENADYNAVATDIAALLNDQTGDSAVVLLAFDELVDIVDGAAGIADFPDARWYANDLLPPGFLDDNDRVMFMNDVKYTIGTVSVPDNPIRDAIDAAVDDANIYAYAAYDAVFILGKAIDQVGNNYDTQALAEAIPGVAMAHMAAVGDTTLDENGDRATADYDIRTVLNGKFETTATYESADDALTIRINLSPSTTTLSSVVGDWDGDGDDDVGAVGLLGSNGYHLFTLNTNGAAYDVAFVGALGAAFQYDRGTITAIVGDWDGDGDTDAGVTGIQSGGQHFLLNANGTMYNTVFDDVFGDISGYMSGTVMPLVGDWDGDDTQDVGVTGIAANGMQHVMLSGDTVMSRYLDDPSGYETLYVIVGDWDGDGADDLGTVGINNGRQLFKLYTGDTVIFEGAIGAASDYRPGTLTHVVGDWDGDGDDDVGAVGHLQNGHQLFTLDINGETFERYTVGDADDYIDGTLTHVVGDWDGDGDADTGATGIAKIGDRYLQYFTLNANGAAYDMIFAGAIGDVADYR